MCNGVLEYGISFLAAVSAIGICYVAWKQWKTDRSRHKYELFDRRFKVYEAAYDFIMRVRLKRGHIDVDLLFEYRSRRLPGEFLLKSKAVDYLKLLEDKGIELVGLNDEIKDLEESGIPEEKVKAKDLKLQRRTLTHWFDEQIDILNSKFIEDLAIKLV